MDPYLKGGYIAGLGIGEVCELEGLRPGGNKRGEIFLGLDLEWAGCTHYMTIIADFDGKADKSVLLAVKLSQ